VAPSHTHNPTRRPPNRTPNPTQPTKRTSTRETSSDLTRAVEALARDGDLAAHGEARQTLRALRGRDTAAFDQVWEQTSGPLPVWLQHLNASLELFEKFLAWIDCPDWDASRAYLQANASDLLTDEAEALIEFIVDRQPAAGLRRVPDLPSFMQYAATGRYCAGCRHGHATLIM
jgi:hypothetical protein